LSRGDRSRQARERSAEERERARAERERRRAGREPGPDERPPEPPGAPLTGAPPADALPPEPSVGPAADEPPIVPAADERAPDAPEPLGESFAGEPVAGEPVAHEAPQEGGPLEPPARAAPFEPPAGNAAVEPPAASTSVEPSAEAAAGMPLEPSAEAAPSEALPQTAPLESPAEEAAAGPSLPAPPAQRLPPTAPPPRGLPPAAPAGLGVARRSRRARVGAVLALLAAVVAVFLVLQSLFHSGDAKTPPVPVVVKVLIPEGKTRLQIAQIAAAEHLSGSYLLASRHSPLLSPQAYGAPAATPTLEGFLFPATYFTNPGESADHLVEEQLIAFRENFGASEIARAHALHETPYQLLTVASMVEREALIPSDRAKIAAVIYNRLRQGMPLGIDATIYYAVELRDGIATYTHELTEAQLHIDSAYNTRTHTGLPPTPISNPGAAAIMAASYPANVPYLYYVAGADGCGEQVFSVSASEFEADAAAYHAAVAKNGGHPPSCKKK